MGNIPTVNYSERQPNGIIAGIASYWIGESL